MSWWGCEGCARPCWRPRVCTLEGASVTGNGVEGGEAEWEVQVCVGCGGGRGGRWV